MTSALSGIGTNNASSAYGYANSKKTTAASFEDALTKTNAADEFLKIAKMSPVERIRYSYLKSKGLDEKSLAELPAEQRKAIEEEIKKLIKMKLHQDESTKTNKI